MPRALPRRPGLPRKNVSLATLPIACFAGVRAKEPQFALPMPQLGSVGSTENVVECVGESINVDVRGGEVMVDEMNEEPESAIPAPNAPEPAEPAEKPTKGGPMGKLGKLSLNDLSPKEILKVLDGLAPAQMKAVGEAAIAVGLVPAPTTDDENGVTLKDGRVRVTLTINPDLADALKQWAESRGESLSMFAVSALESYTQMDWHAMTATG